MSHLIAIALLPLVLSTVEFALYLQGASLNLPVSLGMIGSSIAFVYGIFTGQLKDVIKIQLIAIFGLFGIAIVVLVVIPQVFPSTQEPILNLAEQLTQMLEEQVGQQQGSMLP